MSGFHSCPGGTCQPPWWWWCCYDNDDDADDGGGLLEDGDGNDVNCLSPECPWRCHTQTRSNAYWRPPTPGVTFGLTIIYNLVHLVWKYHSHKLRNTIPIIWFDSYQIQPDIRRQKLVLLVLCRIITFTPIRTLMILSMNPSNNYFWRRFVSVNILI